MKLRAASLATVPALLGLATWSTYPRVGALTYAANVAVEARLAGLRTRVAEVDGLPISYFEGGRADGPTVVLLHGFSADRGVWVRFARHLTRDFHVVIPDLAAHGTTPHHPGDGFSGRDQAGRMARLIDHLGCGPVHLAGNSMGGFVAATLAVEHPHLLRSLALVDAVGVASPSPSDAQRMLDRGLNPFLMHSPAEFPEFYAMTMARPPFAPRFVLDAMAADYVASRDRLAEIFEDFFEVEYLDDRLSEIRVPTLVMWGAEDRLVHVSVADVWGSIRGARKLVYEGIGHMPMVEDPRRSAIDYRTFLQEV